MCVCKAEAAKVSSCVAETYMCASSASSPISNRYTNTLPPDDDSIVNAYIKKDFRLVRRISPIKKAQR